MFMSDNMPIRVPLQDLVGFLTEPGRASRRTMSPGPSAENPGVFGVEQVDGVDIVVTTRSGRTPLQRAAGQHPHLCRPAS